MHLKSSTEFLPAHTIVVGEGVIGLSTALALARRKRNVLVVSNHRTKGKFQCASFAAAANLALKGQVFARDPHFGLKIRARTLYQEWLSGLSLPVSYHVGLGTDVFACEVECHKQYSRVCQDEVEKTNRHLPIDTIQKASPNTIIYQNEAWVHGEELLISLKQTCLDSGVQFEDANIMDWKDLERFVEFGLSFELFICGGAGSLALLRDLALEPIDSKVSKQLGSPRYSVGSTYFFPSVPNNLGVSLLEWNQHGEKCTLSGNQKGTFVSSSTVRTKEPFLFSSHEELTWEKENEKLLHLFSAFKKENTESYTERNTLENSENVLNKEGIEKYSGCRVGYGHSELVTCELQPSGHPEVEDLDLTFRPQKSLSTNKKFRYFLLGGTHKSGFLYAAVMDEILIQLLDY
jgi:FAD dependent oxidoreductase